RPKHPPVMQHLSSKVPPPLRRTAGKGFCPILVFKLGRQELAVQTGDMRNGNALGAFRFAGTRVGAASEAEFVHLGIIALARCNVSTLPCGSLASDETRAATNSMAEPFLQVATQAPQPIHAAASMLSSASSRGIGMVLASGTPPVLTEMNPPACMI